MGDGGVCVKSQFADSTGSADHWEALRREPPALVPGDVWTLAENSLALVRWR